MSSFDVKNMEGQVLGVADVPPSFLASRVTARLLRDAYLMYEACGRQGTVRFKTKGEVSGSKKKIFRQKGTGNARAGQKRTPVRVGGGNAFGRQPKDWSYRLPKKALRAATRMALVGKISGGEVLIVDALEVGAPKTSRMASVLAAFGLTGRSCLIVVSEYSRHLWLSTRNIPRVSLTTAAWVNSHDLLSHRVVLMTRDALSICVGKFSA